MDMDVETFFSAPVGDWDHNGLAVDYKSHMADESFVEDAVHGVAVVNAALGFADDARPRRRHLGFRRRGMDRASARDGNGKV